MPVNRDCEELFRCFGTHEVRFLVIGAHALAWHGRPRFTEDLDILIEPSPENAARVSAALEEFGFGGLGLDVRVLERPGALVRLGREPWRIDLLTEISGVSFEQAWSGRVEGSFGGEQVAYLGLAEFVANKRASGRAKDLADLALLEEMLGPRVTEDGDSTEVVSSTMDASMESRWTRALPRTSRTTSSG